MTARTLTSQAGGSMPLIEAVTRPARLTARAQVRDAARPWYEIRNANSPDEAEMLIYDEIGGWWGTTPDSVVEELRAVTAPNLRVRINSPGGSVFDGVAIANALRLHPANVTVQIDGIAASIASVVAMAGDRIVMTPQSQMMIHEASGLCMGDAADMTEMATLLDLQSDNIADAYAHRAGGTREEWRARMQTETWYLAQQAVDAGLADELLPASAAPEPADEPKLAAKWDLSVFRYAGAEHAPNPEPVAKVDEPTSLTIPIGSALGEQLVAMLKATVEPPAVEDTAAPVHHTATIDAKWDGGAQEKKLPSPMSVATAKAMYGWYDSGQVDGGKLPKSAAKLPHHEVSADGTPGAANLAGVRNALARLPQSDIPEAERAAVERHLQAHLDDAKGADDATAVEPAAAIEPPVEPVTVAAPEEDDWAALTAHLTQGDADDWSALVTNLTEPDTSSSAATA